MSHHRKPLELNVVDKFAAWLPRIMIAAGLLWSFSSECAEAAEDSVRIRGGKGIYYQIDEGTFSYYEKPRPFGFIMNAPKGMKTWLEESFQRKNLKTIAGITVATFALVAVDEQLLAGAKDVGRKLGIAGENNMRPLFRVSGYPVQGPGDLGSAIYFLGDGITHISIAFSMLGYGLINDDPRALQTFSGLAEGLITVAVATQTLKHITGRQSPYHSTEPGGRWRPFPDQIKYHQDIPSYDAFPSGHLATAMMTVTVLAENYPEYTLIRPVGYGLMTLLGFQMMNNGVHWASDYPLAIAIGYGLGKVAVSHGRKIVPASAVPQALAKQKKDKNFLVLPILSGSGGGLAMICRF